MFDIRYNNETIKIYEFEDAESLILRLSNTYKDDKTPVSRGGRGRNTINYYNYACSFDIETTTIKVGQLGYIGTKDAPPVAFPYLFQWNIYKHVVMVRTYTHAIKIFEWLAKYFNTGEKQRLILFVHNLNYEYHFWRDLWEIDAKNCFAMDEHHPVTIVLKNGLMFRDSFKMTNMSLETLTKDWSKHYIKQKEIMDYRVLRTPYTKLDNNTLVYSALDVLSLSEAIVNYLDAKNEKIWTRCPTSTSFIRQNLKKEIGVGIKKRTPEQEKYFDILKCQAITAEQFKVLTAAFRGGNTHANRAYTGLIINNVMHFDITSAHPTEMVCEPEYPVGVWFELDKGSSMDTIKLFENNHYCTLFEVALINPRIKDGVTVPYISTAKMRIVKGFNMEYTDNGRYLRGLECIILSIFGREWDIIEKQYDFDNAVIIKGWFSYKSYLPDIVRRFILQLYAQKTELKNVEGAEIEYALAKTYINGVYGMAATSPYRQSYIMTNNEIIPDEEKDVAETLRKYQNSVSYFMPYCWGAVTSMLTRLFLQKLIDAAGKDFLYCDTDSIFAKASPELEQRINALEIDINEHHKLCGLELTYYDIKGKPHILGGIDREPDVEIMRFWGAKKYITVENGILKCTVAGVPKKKGAEIIGTPDKFKLGLNFEGSITGKNCLWYNDKLGYNLHDERGREIEIYSNVAMLPCDYLLSLGSDYMECLSVEGNFHWRFKEGDKNTINEEDYYNG